MYELTTFRPMDGDTMTILTIGSFTDVVIGLTRDFGPIVLMFNILLNETNFLRLDGLFPTRDYRDN
jgi:hypothetical protein